MSGENPLRSLQALKVQLYLALKTDLPMKDVWEERDRILAGTSDSTVDALSERVKALLDQVARPIGSSICGKVDDLASVQSVPAADANVNVSHCSSDKEPRVVLAHISSFHGTVDDLVPAQSVIAAEAKTIAFVCGKDEKVGVVSAQNLNNPAFAYEELYGARVLPYKDKCRTITSTEDRRILSLDKIVKEMDRISDVLLTPLWKRASTWVANVEKYTLQVVSEPERRLTLLREKVAIDSDLSQIVNDHQQLNFAVDLVYCSKELSNSTSVVLAANAELRFKDFLKGIN